MRESEPESLRAKKARQTRHALHDAAITRVLDEGLECATVANIAADVGVSTRTFFNYYATKEDAIVGLDESSIDATLVDDYVHSDSGVENLAEDTARFVREVLLMGSVDPSLPARRRKLFARYPELVSKRFDRAEALEELVAEHVLARLRFLGQEFSTEDSAWRSARMLTQLCRVPLNHAGQTVKRSPERIDGKTGTQPLFEESLGLFLKVLDRL
ncbi:MAG: TetR/AcrR family transcriptional regulator [Brevibacterium sp.]|uniref:TetR/AcrR family transcriptional regulator n=1 Tax=Brevibacterium sp. TaxID=1701 RepID=UPI0026485BF7|nr:TetR/AcrR family transcriptional regulator [Brevibacterium sp.]MDN5806763.1 TetR/AcrR family transcriptional regulator [Brevibacterium sp.]MDN5832869.1 TetR/AcrR family transcriptional regulator [Brevibacterium sp.]MDN5875984.1 TetR/AcrR family transcriptional regulator [Brevibacterium sp.]MDN5908410.1 TetR/AcrR family transcriptional regulator [Brevibacterium sp.]MDN6157132.1 TetR/AcrR family transcriptional regulator [Brevibacterium sp.]